MADAEMTDGFNTNNGEELNVGDFVCLIPADHSAELYIARIDKMYRDEEEKRVIQIRWFYRPKDLQHEPPSKPLENEIYYTNYYDCQLVESVAKFCKVFTKSEYLKLNEEQRRSPLEMYQEDIYFYEYAYSAEHASFVKFSGSGDAHLQRTLRKHNSPDRTKDVSLKVLIDALLDLEGTLPKGAKSACWTDKRLTWTEKLRESETVKDIMQRLLDLQESWKLIEGEDESNRKSAWRKTLTRDSSPDALLQNIQHLKTYVLQRNGGKPNKRKRNWSEKGKPNKLPLLQDVICEELNDSDKYGGTIKEGGVYEINHKCLPPKAPIHLKSIRAVLVTEKTNVNICVKFPSILALRKYFRKEFCEGVAKEVTPSPRARQITNPALDEQFVMGPKLAGRVLVRQIPSTEYVQMRHLESFWLVNSNTNSPDPEVATKQLEQVKAADSSCVSAEMACPLDGGKDMALILYVERGDDVPIKWGRRRKVSFHRKHRSMEKGDEAAFTEDDSPDIRADKRQRHVEDYQMAAFISPGREKSSILKLPKDMQGRWTSERYRSAQLKLLDIMHQKEAVPGRPILRPALREEARKHIGDTGLLDHLLKHMTDTVISNGERFRRRHNAEGAMEYWLEAAGLMEIRKQAGIEDPSWIPPPGWKPGDKLPLKGYGTGMTPSEAEEMKAIKEEISKLKSELLSLQNINVTQMKRKDQPEHDENLNEVLKDIEDQIKSLRKDLQELQVKSLGENNQPQIEPVNNDARDISQTENLVGKTIEIGAKISSCSILERLVKLETETHRFFEETESKYKAEKKQFVDQFANVKETLDRMQEQMIIVLKSVRQSPESGLVDMQIGIKDPSSEQSLSPVANLSELHTSNQNSTVSGTDKSENGEMSSENRASKIVDQGINGTAREQAASMGFRICKPEGTFIWPSMAAPNTSTRVPLDDVLPPRQQNAISSPIPSEETEYPLPLTVDRDQKDHEDFTISAGIPSPVMVYKSLSKAGIRKSHQKCSSQVYPSPLQQSLELQQFSERQKELVLKYASHLTAPRFPWAHIAGTQISQLSRPPVPQIMSNPVVLCHFRPTDVHGGGGGHVDVPETPVTNRSHSSWLGLAPPVASPAPHNT